LESKLTEDTAGHDSCRPTRIFTMGSGYLSDRRLCGLKLSFYFTVLCMWVSIS